MTDPYAILGVSRDATADEIKAAARRLRQELHPDRNQAPDAAERFKAVQEAYEVLGDPVARRRYDETGETGPDRIEQEAAGLLMDAANAAVKSWRPGNWAQSGLIDAANHALMQRRNQVANERAKAEGDRQHFGKILVKVRTSGRANVFALLAEQTIAQIDAALKAMAHEDRKIDRALAMLAEYDEESWADAMAQRPNYVRLTLGGGL